MNICIRPLRESDTATSWRWRNDPAVWQFTGSRPDRHIDEEAERKWFRRVSADHTCKRFAICVTATKEYIGNVQLTGIREGTAELHIFIGNRAFWGRGVSTRATKLIIDYARHQLRLKFLYLHVNIENVAALRCYEKNGFKTVCAHGSELRQELDLSSAGHEVPFDGETPA